MTDPNSLSPPVSPPAAPPSPPAAPPSPPAGGTGNRNEVDDLRAEAAARRIEARNEREAREKAERERDEAREKAAKDVEEEKKRGTEQAGKLSKRILQSELKAEAVKAGLKDLDLLPLIKQDAMKLGDDGEPVGIEDAIKAFKEAKPEYFKADGGNSPPPPPEPKKPTGSNKNPDPDPNPKPTNVRKLTKEEYNAKKKAELAKLRR